MEGLQQIVDAIDSYDKLIKSAPQDVRADLRRLYPLPRDAEMIREDTSEDYIQEMYDRWMDDRKVPKHFYNVLIDQDHADDITNRIHDTIEIIYHIINEVKHHQGEYQA